MLTSSERDVTRPDLRRRPRLSLCFARRPARVVREQIGNAAAESSNSRRWPYGGVADIEQVIAENRRRESQLRDQLERMNDWILTASAPSCSWTAGSQPRTPTTTASPGRLRMQT